MFKRRMLVVLACAGAPAALASTSCGARNASTPGQEDASMPASEASVIDRAPLADTFHPDGPCAIAIDTPPLLPAIHVSDADITWDSNPPSSGEHFPVWAAFRAYTSPVPRPYYVHDLEHGAVVLVYNCAAGPIDCGAIEAQLQQVSDALPDDPLCTGAGQGVRVRTVITPDPLLDVPVAAAAWGWTYRAQCFDLQTLVDFARAHYGNGPEATCYDGQSTF